MDISVEQWRALGVTSSLLGREIFYVDSDPDGTDPGSSETAPIFLIHGFPTSSWDWAPIYEPLRASRRVIALDLLGFGFSEKPRPHRYSILEQADLCDALVKRLELDAFHVLAHDYGDTVAQELLARQNEGRGVGRWLSVCMLNGGLFPETHRPRLVQKLLLSPLGPLVNKLVTRRTFDKSFSAVFGPDTQPSEDELANFWDLINHNDGRISHLLIEYITERSTHRERWVDALRESVVPVGLINGSLDPVSGAHMVERYREVVDSERFIVELPRVGHYPQVEAPAETLDAYERFLSSAC